MARAYPNSRYVATLTLVSSLILVGGWLIRPAEDVQPPLPLPSENELARLARLAQRRTLDSMTEYFAGVAADAEAALLRVSGAEATAIAWDASQVLTVRLGPPVPDTVTLAGVRDVQLARVALWGPDLPMASVDLPVEMPRLALVRRSGASIDPGDWVVVVWISEDGRAFTPATYQHAGPLRCGTSVARELVTSLPLSAAMAGGGVFDVEGNLQAMILPCDGRLAAIPTASVDRLLAEAASADRRLVALYGLRVAVPAPPEAAHLAAETGGVVVTEVWDGYAADEAGLRPGDVIVAVDEQPVMNPHQMVLMVTTEPTFRLTVARGGERLELSVPPSRQAAEGGLDGGDPGFALEEPALMGHRIESIRPGSAAEAAGLQVGDRLLRIDGEPVNGSEDLRKLFAQAELGPTYLELRRDARRFGVLLQPTAPVGAARP